MREASVATDADAEAVRKKERDLRAELSAAVAGRTDARAQLEAATAQLEALQRDGRARGDEAARLRAQLDAATAARETLRADADAMREQLGALEAAKPRPSPLPPRSTSSLVESVDLD